MWYPLSTFAKKHTKKKPEERHWKSFGFLSSLAIALSNHVKPHMAGAYSDKPNNAPQWLPCESSQTTQECAGSNPPDPPCKAKFIQGRKTVQKLYASK